MIKGEISWRQAPNSTDNPSKFVVQNAQHLARGRTAMIDGYPTIAMPIDAWLNV